MSLNESLNANDNGDFGCLFARQKTDYKPEARSYVLYKYIGTFAGWHGPSVRVLNYCNASADCRGPKASVNLIAVTGTDCAFSAGHLVTWLVTLGSRTPPNSHSFRLEELDRVSLPRGLL